MVIHIFFIRNMSRGNITLKWSKNQEMFNKHRQRFQVEKVVFARNFFIKPQAE